MEQVISKQKLQELSDLVEKDGQMTKNKTDQLKWLFNSNYQIDLENLQIPSFLVISRLVILYFITQKETPERLYQDYFDLKPSNGLEKILPRLQKLKEWVDHNHSNPKKHAIIMESLSPKIMDFIKNKNLTQIHFGLPLPDYLTGRPRITDEYCRYDGCDYNPGLEKKNKQEKLSQENYYSYSYNPKKIELNVEEVDPQKQLVQHLIKNNCYLKGMHAAHEDIIARKNLNIAQIKKKNLITCPSPICNHPNFKTPNELILHLMAFGIPPFWNPEMGPRATQKYHQFLISEKVNKIIFNPTRDHLCQSCKEHINIAAVNYPCLHSGICMKCLTEKLKLSNRCSLCRENISTVFPLSNNL